jgi:hypothetical protein
VAIAHKGASQFQKARKSRARHSPERRPPHKNHVTGTPTLENDQQRARNERSQDV